MYIVFSYAKKATDASMSCNFVPWQVGSECAPKTIINVCKNDVREGGCILIS